MACIFRQILMPVLMDREIAGSVTVDMCFPTLLVMKARTSALICEPRAHRQFRAFRDTIEVEP